MLPAAEADLLPLITPRRPPRYARWLVLQAFAYMILARLALLVVPAVRIQAWQARPVESPTSKEHPIAQIAWAVEAAARRSPIRLVCFPQALAASALLRARHIPTRLHYGAARVNGELTTHVWLEAAGQIVIGGTEAENFSTLAVY